MIADLPGYTEYKPSGCSWIDEIPSHWELRRNGRLFSQRKETGFGHLPILEVSLKTGVRVREFGGSARKQVMSDRDKYKRAVQGDLAYNMMRMWQGAVGVAPTDGLISPAYVVATPHDGVMTKYFSHLFRTDAYKGEVDGFSRGIVKDRNRLYWEDFKQISSCYPPPEEQAAIVRFLAEADRRINRLIRNKQGLIELLNEQKQAIITQAVTRGLEPSVPMKQSGLTWLQNVPAHWPIARIKSVLQNLNTRRVPLSSTERGQMTNRSYDYYGASGVIDRVEDYLFDEDLLLIAEDGANLVLRNLPLAIIATGRYWVNNHAHILRPMAGSLEYYAHLLECINYRPWISGAAQPKLTKDRLMAIGIPVPPAEEQNAIVKYITTETKGLRKTTEQAEMEIKYIREYRTRLTADVATGKLDVRSAAADLPDPVDTEPEPADALDDDADLTAAEEELEEEAAYVAD